MGVGAFDLAGGVSNITVFALTKLDDSIVFPVFMSKCGAIFNVPLFLFVSSCEAISASDYVQFSSQMIGSQSHRHCGQLKELMVTSDKNFLRLAFKSNDRLDGTGFKAEYIFLRDSEMHSITMPDEDSGEIYIVCELLIPPNCHLFAK